MDSNRAGDHLVMIRTLMERSALYRRALTPMMFASGALGVLSAVLGCWLRIRKVESFVVFWLSVGVLALGVSFLLVRRQAMKDREPIWSGPTRRVAHAMLPALIAGALGSLILVSGGGTGRGPSSPVWIAGLWMILFGCAAHSGGYSMPRGIQWLGWIFVSAGLLTFAMVACFSLGEWEYLGHAVMGFTFGCLHVLCGLYLWFTEKLRHEV